MNPLTMGKNHLSNPDRILSPTIPNRNPVKPAIPNLDPFPPPNSTTNATPIRDPSTHNRSTILRFNLTLFLFPILSAVSMKEGNRITAQCGNGHTPKEARNHKEETGEKRKMRATD